LINWKRGAILHIRNRDALRYEPFICAFYDAIIDRYVSKREEENLRKYILNKNISIESLNGGIMRRIYLKRIAARIIDIFLFELIISIILTSIIRINGISLEKIIIRNIFPDLMKYIGFEYFYIYWIDDWAEKFMLMTFFTVFFLAMLMTVFGMTPGKAAMGLRIRAPAERTSFFSRSGFFLAREMRVWISGLGCGFIWLSPFFILWQALRIRGGKPAFYDRHKPAVFEVKRIPVIAFLLWVPLAIILIWSTVMQMFYSFLILRNNLHVLTVICSEERNSDTWPYRMPREVLCPPGSLKIK